MKIILSILIPFFSFHLQADPSKKNKDSKTTLKSELLTKVDGIPWGIEFIDQDQIIMTLKEGKILIYNIKTKKLDEVKAKIPSELYGQGGLLDLMLHPEFNKNKIIYFSYSKKVNDEYTTVIAHGVLKNNELVDIKEIFTANNPNTNSHHFGSRLAHDGKGHLFFTVGDRGKRDLAQSLEADQGKVHRILLDGSIPKNNPYYKTSGARKSIWSYGHRNLQGLKFDDKTQKLFEQEHGPKGGDEINVIQSGKNYGWPVVTYGKEYSGLTISEQTQKKGIENPLYYYVPSIAPSGLELYRGDKIKSLNGKLISGALVLTHLNVLDISSSKKPVETRYFESLQERVRDVKQGPDGYLYFSTDSGKIYKVSEQVK